MQGAKGQKAWDKAERERIRARMEEDKQEKLERQKQQKLAAEETTAAAQSAYSAVQATRSSSDSSKEGCFFVVFEFFSVITASSYYVSSKFSPASRCLDSTLRSTRLYSSPSASLVVIVVPEGA